jgi:hypothetical protein
MGNLFVVIFGFSKVKTTRTNLNLNTKIFFPRPVLSYSRLVPVSDGTTVQKQI